MRKQVFLIDFENVQPDVLPALALEDVLVLVFVGAQQSRLPFALVEAMQKLGNKAQYVKVSQSGKDALDMHIAFHLGRLCSEMPDAYFHIIAKDRDYDPLLLHINEPKRKVSKWDSLDGIPLLERFQANSLPEQTLAAIRWLAERPKNRPATLKTLQNTLLKSIFAQRLDSTAIDAIIALMEKRKVIIYEGQKIRYQAELEVVHA